MAATIAKIVALDAKVAKVDHYGLLEVDRDADRKTIKRAYFRLAATFHPDRFFGKKLGSVRESLERIFHRLTEAHDTLTNPSLRTAYDATLPKQAAPSERHLSKASKAVSRQLEAVKAEAPLQVSGIVAKRRSSRGLRAAAPLLSPPPEPVPEPTPVAAAPAPDRMRRLRAAAGEIKAQANINLLVKAAEDALRANDVVTAANNYRLALSYREDPLLREKYEDTDARARAIRFEKNITLARAAERAERWSDAATFFGRAYEARPDADVAARAGHALRMSGGDLERAAALAEHAVALDAKNLANHITLTEIYIAANRLAAAEAASSRALELAPKDARLKELAAMIAQQAKKLG